METSCPANPVSALQELCQQYGALPSYQEVARSGPSHLMHFTMKVKLGDKEAAGEGPSKKIAKREAAMKLFTLLKTDENANKVGQKAAAAVVRENPVPNLLAVSRLETIMMEKENKQAVGTASAGGNLRGQLAELCQARGLPPPQFEEGSSGPDHCRRFTVSCRVDGGPAGLGQAGSKKEATRLAAGAVLQHILAGDAASEIFEICVTRACAHVRGGGDSDSSDSK